MKPILIWLLSVTQSPILKTHVSVNSVSVISVFHLLGFFPLAFIDLLIMDLDTVLIGECCFVNFELDLDFCVFLFEF